MRLTKEHLNLAEKLLMQSLPEVAVHDTFPHWVRSIGEGHTLWIGNGLVYRTACACVASATSSATSLRFPCRKTIPPGSSSRLTRLRNGRLPSGYSSWPNGAASTDLARFVRVGWETKGEIPHPLAPTDHEEAEYFPLPMTEARLAELGVVPEPSQALQASIHELLHVPLEYLAASTSDEPTFDIPPEPLAVLLLLYPREQVRNGLQYFLNHHLDTYADVLLEKRVVVEEMLSALLVRFQSIR